MTDKQWLGMIAPLLDILGAFLLAYGSVWRSRVVETIIGRGLQIVIVIVASALYIGVSAVLGAAGGLAIIAGIALAFGAPGPSLAEFLEAIIRYTPGMAALIAVLIPVGVLLLRREAAKAGQPLGNPLAWPNFFRALYSPAGMGTLGFAVLALGFGLQGVLNVCYQGVASSCW